MGTPLIEATSNSYSTDSSLAYTQKTGADVAITSRQFLIIAPLDNGYNGKETDLVPGTKIKYTITIKNNSSATANNYYIRDVIPSKTHLYYDEETPSLNGNAKNIEYQGVTYNAGAGNEIKFKYDLDPNGEAYFKYTLTVD